MNASRLIPAMALSVLSLWSFQAGGTEAPPIRSQVLETDARGLVLVQTVTVEAPVRRVWRAYTTEDGWRAWSSPAVAIDLRPGGTIRTHYEPGAEIGDPGTNTLHIVNYVPERVLTLQAEVADRWPDVMKEDAGNLMNVIVFEKLGENRTRIHSYGVGYRDSPAYHELLAFFMPANEALFQNLKDYLEN